MSGAPALAGPTLGALPDLAARRFGEREALVFRDRRITFAEMARRIDATAKGLIGLGVAPGDKVAVWLNNCPEWIELMFALAKIGAIQVPVNTRFRTADLAYVLGQADCAVLVTHDVSGPVDYLAMVDELVPRADRTAAGAVRTAGFPALRRLVLKAGAAPGAVSWEGLLSAGARVAEAELAARAAAVRAEDTVFIMYTSGTTGFPKGVMRHHGFLRNKADCFALLAVTPHDVTLNYLPLFHIFGYTDGPCMSMMMGNRQVLTETFDADQALDLVERERVTLCGGFETHLEDLTEAQRRRPRDVSSLRTGIFPAGMASAAPVVRKAAEALPHLGTITAYGMTEIGANAALSFPDSTLEQRAESSGHPCPGFELRIIDPDTGRDRPTGEPGEILVRTYNLMQGYYKKPEETAAAIDAAGWFHTGDMGYLRPDGYLRFLGRYKDMLKVGGENVDPMEVEGFLLRHPDVHQAAVVSLPDARLTEVPVAFVRPHAGAVLDAEAILAHFRGRIASFKIPRHVVLVDALPMTSTGKIQKVKLREEALARLGPGGEAVVDNRGGRG